MRINQLQLFFWRDVIGLQEEWLYLAYVYAERLQQSFSEAATEEWCSCRYSCGFTTVNFPRGHHPYMTLQRTFLITNFHFNNLTVFWAVSLVTYCERRQIWISPFMIGYVLSDFLYGPHWAMNGTIASSCWWPSTNDWEPFCPFGILDIQHLTSNWVRSKFDYLLIILIYRYK